MHQGFTRLVLPGAVTIVTAAAAAGLMIPSALAATGAAASHAKVHAASHAKVYVATNAKANASDRGCSSAAYNTISAGVSAVDRGGEVVVCGGTYHEDVAVTKRLWLAGESRAVIDAAGQVNGVLVTASGAKVSGITVEQATGEGILVDKANYVTLEGNVVTGNDLGGVPVSPVPTTYAECQAQGGIPGDCGEGIHLMGSSDSTVSGNVSTGNSGGILLSDETGPTSHDRITGNVVTDNLYDCGVTVVGHNPGAAPGGQPAPKVAGVYGNTIAGNTISGNGVKGGGAGVVIATGLPGGAVYDNTVENNTISGDGMSGVTVHSHVPGQYMNGNVVRDNVILVNNLNGDEDFSPHVDTQTTGVLVATVSPLSVEVTGNEIAGDHFGIWMTGPATVSGALDNFFAGDAVSVAQG